MSPVSLCSLNRLFIVALAIDSAPGLFKSRTHRRKLGSRARYAMLTNSIEDFNIVCISGLLFIVVVKSLRIDENWVHWIERC